MKAMLRVSQSPDHIADTTETVVCVGT